MSKTKLKICSKCGKEKEVKEFYADKKQKSGLYPSCKKCKTRNVKKYQNKIYEKSEKRKIMKSQEKILNELKQNGSVLLKDLLEKFENKKELFTDLKELTDARKIGFSEIAGQGLKYYVKL